LNKAHSEAQAIAARKCDRRRNNMKKKKTITFLQFIELLALCFAIQLICMVIAMVVYEFTINITVGILSFYILPLSIALWAYNDSVKISITKHKTFFQKPVYVMLSVLVLCSYCFPYYLWVRSTLLDNSTQ